MTIYHTSLYVVNRENMKIFFFSETICDKVKKEKENEEGV